MIANKIARRLRVACLWMALTWVGPWAAWAAVPNEPPFFAIRGAKLVTVSGETLEEGTLVLAHGTIAALGEDVAIPPQAWVVDGRGLVVYPGLIDSLTNLGVPAPQEGADGGPGGGPSRPTFRLSRGPEDRPETTPWQRGAHELEASDPRIESWREAGFLTVVTAPDRGIFPGQASVINLVGERPEEMVLADGAALRVNFERARGRVFPSSLMGVIAYVRQVFLDAEWYRRAWRAYESHPRGQGRPMYDRTLEPIRDAQERGLPVLLPAHLTREIDRALRLGDELGLNTLLYGAHQAYEAVELLEGRGTAVLVSLKWPEADRNADPEQEESLRTLRHRALAPSSPRALAEAGVKFAFYSDGLASPRTVLKNVARAVEAGLEPAAAIRSLTLDAAQIYGLDDSLGSLEVGKIANLVVADGDPWDAKTRVRMVFVDGHKYEMAGESRPAAPPEVDVTGTWTLSLEGRRGAQEVTAQLEMAQDGSLSGELTSPRGTSSIDEGWVSGQTLNFTIRTARGPRSFEMTYNGEVEGETVRGTASFGSSVRNFEGERTAAGPETTEAPPTSVVAAASEPEPALAPPPEEEPRVTLIRNATVVTLGPRGTLAPASILIRDGKIARVGSDLKAPQGARVIDASDQFVAPGIIDCHSHIAVDQGVNEGSVAVSAMVGIEDVINPEDINIYRALAGGVTTANVLHGSSNPIGGKNAVIKTRWGEDARGLLFEGAPPGIKFALGENPKRSNFNLGPGNPQRYPATRMGVMDVIRQAFTEARQYQARWQSYEERAKGEPHLVPPRRDLKLEALVEILEGRRRVHAHSYRADEILQLLRLAEEFGFRIATFQHVLEGYKVAREIAEHGAGASTFSDWWAYKVEAYDAIPYNAALMTERGVVVSINSDSAEEMRHLNQEAAKTMKWGGLSETEALKLVTLNPARQLGIDSRVGSIEEGKDADLVIFNDHPLSVYAVAQKTLIDGRVYFDRDREEARLAAIAKEKKALQEGKGESPAARGETPSRVQEVTP